MQRLPVHKILGAFMLVPALLACGSELDEGAHEAFNDCAEVDLPDLGENFKEQALTDCTPREDTGYTRGSPFPISVVTLDDKPVERDTANAFYVMQAAAARDGVNIRIVSGFRTNAQQRYLYNCYINRNCNNGNLAAYPGYSNHQSGHALDLNTSSSGVYNWLDRNGASFGFRRTVPSERWHWEWWGGGPGGGICFDQDCTGDDGFSIETQGSLLQEDDSCTTLHGPSQYWRSESGGSEGFAWTGAIAGSSTTNYSQWVLAFESSGVYRVDVYIPESTRPSQQARYTILHGGQTSEVVLDQRRTGWNTLGAFNFDQSVGQSLRVNDNTGERSSLGRRVLVDAIRVMLPGAAVPPPDEPTPDEPTPDEPTPDEPGVCPLLDNGGVIDEEQDCVELGGPAQYLRDESGRGYEGGYMWTGATASSRTYNYAAWSMPLSQPGRFLIEVNTPAGATSQQADYVVTHAQGTEVFVLDQSAQNGFAPLGILRLDSNHNIVTLGDNTGERSSRGRRVAFDALRLTPASEVACSEATTTAVLNIRRDPNTSRTAIGNYDNGESFERISTVSGQNVGGSRDWYRVSFAGQTGYVSAQFAECNP